MGLYGVEYVSTNRSNALFPIMALIVNFLIHRFRELSYTTYLPCPCRYAVWPVPYSMNYSSTPPLLSSGAFLLSSLWLHHYSEKAHQAPPYPETHKAAPIPP